MDCIEVAVLKKTSEIVSPYLKTAFKKCIYVGVFRKVMPIFKAGETNLASITGQFLFWETYQSCSRK